MRITPHAALAGGATVGRWCGGAHPQPARCRLQKPTGAGEEEEWRRER